MKFFLLQTVFLRYCLVVFVASILMSGVMSEKTVSNSGIVWDEKIFLNYLEILGTLLGVISCPVLVIMSRTIRFGKRSGMNRFLANGSSAQFT